MAEICCGVVSENEAASKNTCEHNSQAARRKRMELQRLKYVAGVPSLESENGVKQARLSISPASFSHDFIQNKGEDDCGDASALVATILRPTGSAVFVDVDALPKFGVASVCGRRRDMEDAVAIHPSFLTKDNFQTSSLHYFGVYDGHGCSHVATRCKDRLHLLVKEELNKKVDTLEWTKTMEQSFFKMDKEVVDWNKGTVGGNCRCELQAPESDAVGSTAVVAVMTPDKIIVANCGDSRAVLCRNGKAVPLSVDHKPDRPDELNRIQAAGGRVIYWEGARVLGVLAMSRAIGDNYLKPYVSCEPEVTITDRTGEDECLIIASDGLWDVVSNDTACGVARMCLKGKKPAASITNLVEREEPGSENWDKPCSDAAMLLTKLALARRSADNVSVVVIDLRKK
ncbi:Protein phosphatase 2C [Artemisia annua]|uniref:protein-serine/threonine phosphatase n=1 Tax=Artemisia annua TaxID=35608 RepID=A0A2U1LBV4_ARTAN|nr:Protein phosphatase 2C [Artemisia annua]